MGSMNERMDFYIFVGKIFGVFSFEVQSPQFKGPIVAERVHEDETVCTIL